MKDNLIEIRINIISESAVNLYLHDYKRGDKAVYEEAFDVSAEPNVFKRHVLTNVKAALLNVLYKNDLPKIWAEEGRLRPIFVSIDNLSDSQICLDGWISVVRKEVTNAFNNALADIRKTEEYCKFDNLLTEMMFDCGDLAAQKPYRDIFRKFDILTINIDYNPISSSQLIISVSSKNKSTKRVLICSGDVTDHFDLYLETVESLSQFINDIKEADCVILAGNIVGNKELTFKLFLFINKIKSNTSNRKGYDWIYKAIP